MLYLASLAPCGGHNTRLWFYSMYNPAVSGVSGGFVPCQLFFIFNRQPYN
jgi:hypothetical protein